MPSGTKRPRRYVETGDFLKMMGRMMKAAKVRAGDNEPEEFRQLAGLEVVLQELLAESVKGLRRSGMTWEEIGKLSQHSRQAAHQRWARRIGEVA